MTIEQVRAKVQQIIDDNYYSEESYGQIETGYYIDNIKDELVEFIMDIKA